MSNRIRVGILGCASIARRSLAPAFFAHPFFELAAVASRSASKAHQLADGYCARACSYDELVSAADIDLIYCPLPTGLHYEWVARALLAGKHVLCEKSLTCSWKETMKIVELARERHLFLMESFQFRFHPQNLYVRDLLKENRIGPLRQVVVRFGVPSFPEGKTNIRYSAELGGGALLDNGAYMIKCMTYLLGCDVKVLAAVRGGMSDEFGNVDTTGSFMALANGVPVQASYGFDHFYQNGYEIWGRDGKISTTRAFTARKDFSAPVIVDTAKGREVREFKDDHFVRLLDYVGGCITDCKFEDEYEQCLVQARLIQKLKEIHESI